MNRFRVICFIAVGLIATSGAAAAGSGPMTDAGLDQTVSVNTTVQLDATGSTHPNGDIESYEWRIETPDGREIHPECTECSRTAFRPGTVGRYAVTVIVTDSEGETASDTLYVDVEGTPGDSRDVAETPDEEAGSDPVGSGTQNEERGNTIELDENNVGGSISEVNYETTIEINQCNAVSETGTGYTNSGNIDDCTDSEPIEPDEEANTELTVEVSNYERGEGMFEDGILPDYEEPRFPETKGSEGMGMRGEVNSVVGKAQEQQQGNTGWLEGALYGADSAEVTTYETDGENARKSVTRNSWGSGYWHEGQTNGPVESGYNNVEHAGGAAPSQLDDDEQVQVTVVAGEGSGIFDTFSVTNVYSREDYESDRSAIGGIPDGISSGVSGTVEGVGNLLKGGDNGNNDESSIGGDSINTRDTTAGNDDSSDSSPLEGSAPDPDYNNGPTQDDSGDRGVGYSTEGGTSGGSSENDSASSSNTDWKIPDDIGSDNDAGYATTP